MGLAERRRRRGSAVVRSTRTASFMATRISGFAPILCANSLRQLFAPTLCANSFCLTAITATLATRPGFTAPSALLRTRRCREELSLGSRARVVATLAARPASPPRLDSCTLAAVETTLRTVHRAPVRSLRWPWPLRPAPLHPCETAGSLTTASFNAPSALLHAFAAVETTLRYPGTLVRWQTHHRCFNRHAATSAPLSLF